MPVTHINSKWIEGDLHFRQTVAGLDPQILFGVDDTGLDVKFFGATSGSYMLWDQSNDYLDLEEATIQVGARAASGDGVTIVATDGGQQRALMVCVDDGGTALTAGWCQAILGSTEVYTTFNAAASVFGTSGEVWLNESVTTSGNISGIQGAAVMKTGKTATANVFGVTLGTVWPTGAVLASGFYTGGAIIGGHYEGTMTGKVVGIFFQNPTSASQMFDYAFAFGQNDAFAGCVTVAAVGGSNTHKLKVIAGGTDFFIPMYTA
jgi:hypothetical protein